MKHIKPLLTFTLACMLASCGVHITSTSVTSLGPTSSSTGETSSSTGGGTSSTGATSQSTGTGTQSSEESKEPLPAIDHVQVFCPKTYTHIWAWTKDVNIFTEGWPGKQLSSYNDSWNTYDFEGYTALYVIFSNNGSGQTDDLKIEHAGYYWYQGSSLTESNVEPSSSSPVNPGHPDVDIPTGDHKIVKKADTWRDFPLWSDLPADHWKTVSPYKGSRDDFRDESIYFTITTRFYDGDKSNNARCWDGRNNSDEDPAWRGDFKGLIEKMDYIKALGFTAIWITPIVENASGYDYHGYHALNFKKVDHRYESEDVAFLDVIKAAHARDMKIILDVVFNHTGNFGEENLFPMFYKYEEDTTINGMLRQDNDLLPSNYASLPGGQQYSARIDAMKNFSNQGGSDDEYIYHHEKNMAYEQYIEQTGQMAGDCVDLNTENPTVCNYLVEAYGEFIRMGVDAFRIDTMKHISRLTFNNYLWPALYEYANKCGNSHFFMFGEVCTRVREVWNHGNPADSCPFYTWKETGNYAWGDTDTNLASTEKHWNDNSNPSGQPTSSNAYLKNGAYHAPDHSKWSGVSVIDFPMHWNFQYARDAYNVAVNNDSTYNDATYNVTYVDSHDYGPDGAEKIRYNEGTNAWKENMSLIFTFRGVPCIYYGSEIEFQKGKVIDEGPNLALKDSGRAYFGDHLEGSLSVSNFGDYTSASGEIKKTLDATLSQHLRKLNKIRLQVPALRRGQYQSFGDLKFVRRYTAGGVDSVAAVAISGGCTFAGLPNGTYKDLYGGGTVNVSNGSLTANVSGQGNIQIWVKQ